MKTKGSLTAMYIEKNTHSSFLNLDCSSEVLPLLNATS